MIYFSTGKILKGKKYSYFSVRGCNQVFFLHQCKQWKRKNKMVFIQIQKKIHIEGIEIK
jgi:hypothetical protein